MSATSHALTPRSKEELVELFRGLRDGDCVRLVGSGSKQSFLAAVPEADREQCRELRLDGLRSIHRMEAADLTCSVGAGLPLAELCQALAERGVELPGTVSLLEERMDAVPTGTVGGLHATGYVTPAAPGAWTPRNTLLGFEAVLAEGLAFKAGARVVKNVAGFDLNKLFVGSQGLLFAATTLHLKLRAVPPARRQVVRTGLEQAEAVALYSGLRREPAGVEALRLERGTEPAHTVRCILSGRPELLDAVSRRHQLEVDESTAGHAVICGQHRVLGTELPSEVRSVLERFPSPIVIDGTGGYLTAAPNDDDGFWDELNSKGPWRWTAVLKSPEPAHFRFRTTYPGQGGLIQRLLQALDPGKRLR